MADGDLEFLLKSYRFLDKAIATNPAAMTTGDRDGLLRERATAFRQLLTHRSQAPSIALAQLRTLLDCLSQAPHDAGLAALVADASRQHLDQIAMAIPTPPRTRVQCGATQGAPGQAMWPDADRLSQFDAMSDRIVILDTHYRYRFSNKANALFHATTADAFIDRPLWAMTDEAFFHRVTKPVFDRCFAGQSTAFVTHHPGRDPSELHSGHLDPILDAKGRVVGALAVARLIGVTGPEQHSRA